MFNYTRNFKSRWKEIVKFNDIGWLNRKFTDAAKYGDLETVKEYLFLGVNIHAWDDAALRLAALNGHLEIVVFLVENGANIHAWGDCALRWAAKNGHKEIVEYLEECMRKENV